MTESNNTKTTASIKFGILGLLLVFGGAVIAFWIMHADSPKAKSKSAQTYGIKQSACDVFNPIYGYQILGGVPVVIEKNKGLKNDSPNDIKASNCIYSPATTMPGSVSQTATLLVQSPITAHGVALNKSALESKLPLNDQKVAGYGDATYWDASAGQLNVLKHNTKYTLTIGSANAADRTLAQAKQLADLLLLGTKSNDQLPSHPSKPSPTIPATPPQ